MGAIFFSPKSLADNLSETAGYKAGLALSIEHICDHLSGTHYPDLILESEETVVRLRAEDYEALFYKLLYRIGYAEEEYDGDYVGAKRFHKYRKNGLLAEFEGVLDIYHKVFPMLIENAKTSGKKSLDPTFFIMQCYEKYGNTGLEMALEQIDVHQRAITLSPHSIGRANEWTSPISLQALFSGTDEDPEHGRFIDQRYINYLAQNKNRIPDIHWRKFEELTAEFFARNGYEVEIGPGRNDDGVDIRVWKPGTTIIDNPLCLIQCKRQKSKIEKVIVKGLYADVEFEQADYGVIVTSSELSLGARKTIKARGYPILEVDNNGVAEWLKALRTPGTGIIRV